MKRPSGREAVGVFAIAAVLSLGMMVALPLPDFAQSQSLTTTTGTVVRSYSQNGFGIDLGQITFAFSGTSVTWTDNWVPSTTYSFKVPTFGGVALTPALAQNSTAVQYHFSGAVSGRTLSADMLLTQMKEPDPYNYKIAVIGTLSGSATTIPIAFAFPSSALQQGSSVCVSHLCFSFGDSSAYSPSFNNSTKVLTFTVGNSFNIDPVAVDGSQVCNISTSTTSCTETFSTAKTNDILIQYMASTGTLMTLPTSTAFAFTQLLIWSSGKGSAVYYGFSGVSGSMTVTCKVTTTGTASGCVIQAISGADLTHWLDGTCGVSVNSQTCSLTTYNANDILIGMGVNGYQAPDGMPPAPTQGTGFTMIATSAQAFTDGSCSSGSVNLCGWSGSEYDIVSNTGSQTISIVTNGDWFSVCGIAIAQSPSSYQTPTVTNTVTSTVSSTTSTTTSSTTSTTTSTTTTTTTTKSVTSAVSQGQYTSYLPYVVVAFSAVFGAGVVLFFAVDRRKGTFRG